MSGLQVSPPLRARRASLCGGTATGTDGDCTRHEANCILTPGRYVGMAEVEEDDEPFEETMERLIAQLEAAIRGSLGLPCGTEGS